MARSQTPEPTIESERPMPKRRLTFAAPFLAAVALLLCMTPRAHSQPENGGIGSLESRVARAEIEPLNAKLSLTPEQRDAAKLLFDGYLEQHMMRVKKINEQQEQLREEFSKSRDPAVWKPLDDTVKRFVAETREAEQTLWTDIRSLLTKEQAELWPTFERARNRMRLPKLMAPYAPGVTANLMQIIDKLKLPESDRAKIEPALDAYESELDAAIVAHTEFRDRCEHEIRRLIRTFPPEEAAIVRLEEFVTKDRQACTRIAETHRRYAAQVQTLLPEALATSFTMAYKRICFPTIYRERPAARDLASADSLDDLTPDQRSGLTALKDSYTSDSAALAKRTEATIVEAAPKFNLRSMLANPEAGDPSTITMREFESKQQAIDKDTAKKLESILSKAQFTRLSNPGKPGNGEDAIDPNR